MISRICFMPLALSREFNLMHKWRENVLELFLRLTGDRNHVITRRPARLAPRGEIFQLGLSLSRSKCCCTKHQRKFMLCFSARRAWAKRKLTSRRKTEILYFLCKSPAQKISRFAIQANRGKKIRMMNNFWANKFAIRSLFNSLPSSVFEWMRMNEATDSEMNAISSAFIIAALRCFSSTFFLLRRVSLSASERNPQGVKWGYAK